MAGLDVAAEGDEGTRLRVTIHLSHREVTAISASEAPSQALAALLLANPLPTAIATVIPAVARRTAWRLPSKDRRFGHRGVRITFTAATDMATANRAIAHALAATRIREPGPRRDKPARPVLPVAAGRARLPASKAA